MGKRRRYGPPIYTDLEKAVRELGTVWILRTINAAINRAGDQRRRKQEQAERARLARQAG